MKWSDDYKIGLAAIDSQHKRLFELIGDLNSALRAGLSGAHLEKLLSSLDQYKTRHFQLEEKYMKECSYPGLAEQQEAHAYFSARFVELGEEMQRTGMTSVIVNAVKEELSQWVQEHVTGLDMQFGRYYRNWKDKQGAGNAAETTET
ncbi:MAG: hemerythrin family protein [Desulfopila sp.]|nr:hemerythrin family protein [Desulfopila sp.]